jgi:hypothetical protein
MDSCDNEDENDIIEEDETEEDITDDLLIMQMLGML